MSLFDLFRTKTSDPHGPLPLEPANDLERHLSAFVSGAAPLDPFLQELLRSQVAMAFTWVVQATPVGLGLIVNPGWSVSIEQPPEGLVAFRNTLAPGAPGPAV